MPVLYLKSGGCAIVGGYTVKEGVFKVVDVEFKDAGLPPEKAKQAEAVIPADNVLFVIPGR
ncbi:MAG: hypothetical protein ABIK44_01660 [candidate division WOR-3 bacterium]